jgi:hypothetical protein
VSAVIVTRGDVDLGPILETLPYDETVIWDNSQHEQNWSVFGRYLAIGCCKHDVVYFQDDDIVFTAHKELLAAFDPQRITCNMPSPWYERTEYDKLGCYMVGAGSLVPKHLPGPTFGRYLDVWPYDDLFFDYCDFVNGILSPGLRLDLGYEILEHATAPGRINTLPNSHLRREAMLRRVLDLREAA